MRNKVYVVGADYGIVTMFLRRGWEVVNYIDDKISLIQFTGGEDVDPSYYGETRHPRSHTNPVRDAREAAVYNEWVGKVPMAGICRGGQFLNAMNGGRMWQHVDNHGLYGTHEATDLTTGAVVQVTSTHHQMIDPTEEGTILMTARIASFKEAPDYRVTDDLGPDIEAVWYQNTNCLCYQPHPEYCRAGDDTQEIYFNYLAKMGV